jgi:hypothetical protein
MAGLFTIRNREHLLNAVRKGSLASLSHAFIGWPKIRKVVV